MKNFEKPVCEVVSFKSDVITGSACGCYDEDFGVLEKDCLGDVAYCACTINTNPAVANCCYTYEG